MFQWIAKMWSRGERVSRKRVVAPQRPISEALESRILFSADLPWAAMAPSVHDAFERYGEELLVPAEAELAEIAAQPIADEPRLELVFIDARVTDAAALIEAIDARDDPHRIYDVVVLEPDQDGIAQVAAALAQRDGVDAVHLVTHGSADGVQLGSTWLSAETIDDHLGAIESWGTHLDDAADLLIYGCDLAGSAEGLALLEQLGSLTGADVAASDDTTGHALLGGDWDLEYTYGVVEAAVAVDGALQEAWREVLAAPVITSNGGGPAAGVSVVEGTTAVTTVTATDADSGDVLTYSISGGTDAARFAINASSGALTFLAAPNFDAPADADADNVYEVTVRVGDGNGGFDTQAISVTVADYAVARYLAGAGDGSDVPVGALTSSAPTDPSLDNFDPGRDANAGLLLARSSSGVNESDPTKYQLWLEPTTGSLIDGSVRLTLWTAMKDFDVSKAGSITAYLVDSDASGSNVTVIASATVSRADWDSGNSGTWIEDTFDFGYVNYDLASGRHPGVKIVVNDTSADDMWLAYDAVAYPSALTYTVGNDAPVLSGANDLASIAEDDVGNAGTLVQDLIAGQVTDADAPALRGIAVIGVDDTNGTWQYSTNGGGSWTAFGAVDSANARLLASDGATRVRFVPDANYVGTVTNGITFHAWDQTTGTAGGTADLNGTMTVRDEFTTAAYDNDDGTANWTSNWIETNDSGGAGATGGDLQVTGGELRISSNGGSVESIARAVDLSGAASATLTFDFRTSSGIDTADAVAVDVSANGGATWVTLETFTGITGSSAGSRSYDISGYASASTQIRARIANNYSGTNEYFYLDNVQIQYTGTGTGTGGTTAFSSATASSGITVNNVNDAPTGSVTIDNMNPAEGDALTASNTLADADGLSGPVSYQWQRNGVAIAGATGGTYTTTQADVGAVITVVASYTDDQGTPESVSSAATAAVTNVNQAPTGSVTIDNMNPAEGDVLTASNTLADADGLSGPIGYQWQRNGVAIAGATSSTYTTTQADVGAVLRVVASYTDDQGTAESVTSGATAAVTNINDAPTGAVTIDNLTPAEGDLLTASNTLADADGLSGPIGYQWQRNGVAIGGATGSTYTTTQADVGAVLTVVASYTDDEGTLESVASAATAAVTNVNDAPTGAVTIDNLTPAEGDLLTASNTLADADGLSGPISYQWQRDGVAIAGATGSTYTTAQADVGGVLTVVASYTDDQGTAESVTSGATAAVTNVNDAPTGAVTIDNLTPAEGDLLTASNTLADADGISGPIGYQWQRDGVAIAGATGSTYTTTQADVGAVLTVVASYTDDEGTLESVASAATAAVTNVNAAPTGNVTINNMSPAEGDLLTASNTLADADGLSGPIGYQWQRNGVAIAGATGGTYTTTQADVGAVITVVASYTDDQGTPESVSSTPTAAVTSVNAAPTGSVTIDNMNAAEGDVLTASNTLADADGLSGPISYQWQRDGVAIVGATGSTYTTTQADVGTVLTVVATYTDNQSTVESVTSAATAAVTNVNDAPTGAVTIDNLTPAEGDLLTASNTLADADGLSGPISYQWQRNGVAIAGATGGTYTTTQADVGGVLTVVASYTDDEGSGESFSSAATVPVNPAPSGTPFAQPPPEDPPSIAGIPTRDSASVVGASSAVDRGQQQADSQDLFVVPTEAFEALAYAGSNHKYEVIVTAADGDEAGIDNGRLAHLPPLPQRVRIIFDGANLRFLVDGVEQTVLGTSPELAAALDGLAENSQGGPINLPMAGAVVASVSLSSGFVVWMLRSGALLASLLAARPAWTNLDPLPIFDRRTDGRDEEEHLP